MLRAACLRPLLVVALVLVASGRPAVASDPLSTYVVPSLVELQPDEATATRVVIHGAFFNLASTTAFTYTDPKCGVMYFQCVPGQEAMCRMQWKELRAAITPNPTLCRGFGTLQVVSTATLRVEGQSLGAPDSWDLGMGVGTGSSVDNKCPAARALSCPLSGSGAGGAGGSGGTAGRGAAGSNGAAGATGGGATAGASGGVAGAVAGTSGGVAGAAAGTSGVAGAAAGTSGGVAGAAAGTSGGVAGAAAGTSGGVAGAAAGTSGGVAGAAAGTSGVAGAAAGGKPGPGCAIAGSGAGAMGSLALLALGALIAGVRRRRR